MRLIDADALKSYIDCGHLRPPTEVCFSEFDVCSMIDNAPTIDAVEVVRCKDCKRSLEADNDLLCDHLSKLVGLNVVVKDTDFCSYGERSEE